MLATGISESAIDHFAFRAFLDQLSMLKQPYSEHIQTRRTRSGVIIDAMHHIVEKNLHERLQKSSTPIIVSATSDAWTSRASQHKYVSVTIHWLDDAFDYLSELLNIRQLDERHTSINIKDLWDQELAAGVLKNAILVSMNTDNGANFRSASAMLVGEDNTLCAAHTLQVRRRGNRIYFVLNIVPKNLRLNFSSFRSRMQSKTPVFGMT